MWQPWPRFNASLHNFPPCGHHALLDPVAASNAFSCNFANNGHRNSIQFSNLCVMCWKGHFKNHFQYPMKSWATLVFARALDIPFEYWIEHVTFGLLYFMFSFSTRVFYRGVPGFATDCPCGVWWRGLTTCLLYVGPLFGNPVWNDNGFSSLT